MKTFTAIREDLRNIRYYYSRRDEMTQTAKIVGECKVLKTVSRNVSNANTVAMEYVNGQIDLSEK